MQKLAVWTCMMMNSVGYTAQAFHLTREAVVAQAALESAWGAAAIGNNLFGIKADKSWTGLRRDTPTQEVINGQRIDIVDSFRDYATVADSIADHFEFLRRNGYYANIVAEGRAGTLTDERYFQLLQQDGYATDPQYANKLMGMLGSVRIFTSAMINDADPVAVAAAPPPGYSEMPSGNIMRTNIDDSQIVKNSNQGALVAAAASTVAIGAPAATAVAGMDWKAMLALSAVIVAGTIAFLVYKLIQSKTARIQMHDRGIA